ncbi:hypothetical protein AQUSIP_17200 [Aquicella siphonis]|uniref:Uncharacterized protein n=1 Tax=Aquicella siphonis TaxID=254247 RepID=A0A5E4PIX8_9COXI|nr:hypothetical protein [Aquicella siphonis]VVC76408.1 hypothetical protein AQUSIP_17200 [Aquicella siphonis]
MTPSHYTRRKLISILKDSDYSLYHWSPLSAARNIIRDGYIYSKATLFGLHYPNVSKLNHIKPSNALSEAQHGFTDYIFLGNTNWIAEGATCYYGDICFVIRPMKVLPFREFFVFPFNTGRNFSNTDDTQQVSDLSILVQALECQHPCYEILVRRRLKINSRHIKEILCKPEAVSSIQADLADKSIIDIPVRLFDNPKLTGDDMSNDFSEIEIVDPLDGEKKYHTYKRGDFIQKADMLYVGTKFSNCMLEVKIVNNKNLIDPFTNEQIGRIKSEATIFMK